MSEKSAVYVPALQYKTLLPVVAFLVRDPHIGPKLSELVSVDGFLDGQYVFHDLKEVVT